MNIQHNKINSSLLRTYKHHIFETKKDDSVARIKEQQKKLLLKYGRLVLKMYKQLLTAGFDHQGIGTFMEGRIPLEELFHVKNGQRNIIRYSYFESIVKDMNFVKNRGGLFGPLHYINSDISETIESRIKSNRYGKQESNENIRTNFYLLEKEINQLEIEYQSSLKNSTLFTQSDKNYDANLNALSEYDYENFVIDDIADEYCNEKN